MEKVIITFQADQQNLIKTGGPDDFASDTVEYIEAHFNLGENWQGYDVINAIWRQGTRTIARVLDQDGVCSAPPEIQQAVGKVYVNLAGSVIENNTLAARLTTGPIQAINIKKKAFVSGEETPPITPSQFEQFVDIVEENVQAAYDAKIDAESAQRYAEAAQTAAETAQEKAEDAQEDAEASMRAAAQSEINAAASETNAGTQALKSEGYAVGRQNGQFVGSDSPYYHNNAKYYNEQAGSSAQSAANSEANAYLYKGDAENAKTLAEAASSSAQTNALKAEGYAVGEQNGEPVASGSPYYENNAEYYKEQAWAAVAALDLGLSVINGEINITYEEA